MQTRFYASNFSVPAESLLCFTKNNSDICNSLLCKFGYMQVFSRSQPASTFGYMQVKMKKKKGPLLMFTNTRTDN